ncbi:MAG: hypothetical protein ACE149_17970 [Armatimonadota bacterium]
MGSIPLGLAGYFLAILVGLAAYSLGRRSGAIAAHRLWADWTGIKPGELQSHKFDRELRSLRREIGRPADGWPEEGKED